MYVRAIIAKKNSKEKNLIAISFGRSKQSVNWNYLTEDMAVHMHYDLFLQFNVFLTSFQRMSVSAKIALSLQ